MTEGTLKLRSNRILVRLTRPADRSAGGIWLPDARETKTSEGRVLSTGPGLPVPDGLRAGLADRSGAVVWVMEGDLVLFPEHCLERTGKEEGIVRESDLLATVFPEAPGAIRPDRLAPEGEWVLIDPDPAPRISRAGVHLADKARQSPRSGVVRELGPGELRLKGPLAGLRCSCRWVMNLAEKEEIRGRRVYWDAEVTTYHAAGFVFVRARDILCVDS